MRLQGIDEAGERERFSSAVRSPASFVCAGQWIAKPTRRSVLLAICT